MATGACLGVLVAMLTACDEPRADSADHVRELLQNQSGVASVESERVELDSEYWGVETEVRIESDITANDLETVLEVLDEADELVAEEAGFLGTVLYEGDSRIDNSSYVRSGSEVSPDDQARAFLGAQDMYPGSIVAVNDWGIEIRGIDPEGRYVSSIAIEIGADSRIAAFDQVSIGVADTMEGAGNANLDVDLPMESGTVNAWQSVVDAAATVGGDASVEYVSVQALGPNVDRVELNLLGVGEGVPDFATWHPVLAPTLNALADLAVERGSDATLSVMTDHEAFVLVDVGPPAEANQYADATWNQSVVDHLRNQGG